MRILSVMAISVSVAFLSVACSPHVYREEIRELTKAVVKVQSTFNALRDQEYEATVEVDARAAFADPALRVVLRPNCQAGKPKTCGLELKDANSATPFPQETLGKKTAKLLKGLADYAKSLATIAGSEDADAVNEAAGKASSAIGSLAKNVSKTSTQVTAGVGFFDTAFKWIVGAYVDQKRYNALRNAVTVAAPLVVSSGDVLKDQLPRFIRIIMKNKMSRLDHGIERLEQEGTAALKPHEKLALMKALAEESRSLRALAAAKPKSAITKLVEAHSGLKKALEDETGQVETVFKRISEFSEHVEDLRKAIKAN